MAGRPPENPLYTWLYELDSFDQPDAAERSVVFATRYGKIAIADCFDGEFPESIRRMRLAGAEILLWSNAAIGDSKFGTSNRIDHSGCHALTNHMWVASSNCAAKNSSGTSLIVGPDGLIRYHWPEVIPEGHAQRVEARLVALQAASK